MKNMYDLNLLLLKLANVIVANKKPWSWKPATTPLYLPIYNQPKIVLLCRLQWEQMKHSGQNKQGDGQSQARASEILLARCSVYLHISGRERLL